MYLEIINNVYNMLYLINIIKRNFRAVFHSISEVSSFCPSSWAVTLITFPYLSLRTGCGVSISVFEVDVDMDSGLDWGVVVLLFLCFVLLVFVSPVPIFYFFLYFSVLLSIFSSSSEPHQFDLRSIGYSVGHCFPTGVQDAQYPGDF